MVDDEVTRNEEHKRAMQELKTRQRELVAARKGEKGLLIVHTGSGKGKSTAAFGLVLRSAGHGLKCAVLQFIKGAWTTGEQRALTRFSDLVTFDVMGEGFTWDTQDRARDIEVAEKAWSRAKELLADPTIHLVVLDELNIALRYGYLSVDTVLADLAERPAMMHVVVTGRDAPAPLRDAADLVTEMGLVKHPFENGIKAQRGIEF